MAFFVQSNEEEDLVLIQRICERYRETLPSLTRGKGWSIENLVHFQGFWFTPKLALKGFMGIQDRFKPRPTDVFLVTFLKTVTTWLKALVFATIYPTRYGFFDHPLHTNGPHNFIPFLDAYNFQNDQSAGFNLDAFPSPHLLSTHMPSDLLPDSMTSFGRRFVYICRHPKDVLVSKWLFMNKLRRKELPPLSLEEAFELFCQGISHYGPYWDQCFRILESELRNPRKNLVLEVRGIEEGTLGWCRD